MLDEGHVRVLGDVGAEEVEGFAHRFLLQDVEGDAYGHHLAVDAHIGAEAQAVGDAAFQLGGDAQLLPFTVVVPFGEVVGAPAGIDVVVDAVGLDRMVDGGRLHAHLAGDVVHGRQLDERRDEHRADGDGGEDHREERLALVHGLPFSADCKRTAYLQVRFHIDIEGIELRVGDDGLQGQGHHRVHLGRELQAFHHVDGPAGLRNADVEGMLVRGPGAGEGNLLPLRIQDLQQAAAKIQAGFVDAKLREGLFQLDVLVVDGVAAAVLGHGGDLREEAVRVERRGRVHDELLADFGLLRAHGRGGHGEGPAGGVRRGDALRVALLDEDGFVRQRVGGRRIRVVRRPGGLPALDDRNLGDGPLGGDRNLAAAAFLAGVGTCGDGEDLVLDRQLEPALTAGGLDGRSVCGYRDCFRAAFCRESQRAGTDPDGV